MLHQSSAIIVENFCAPSDKPGRGYSDQSQIVLPYCGAFTWTVGEGSHFLDANTALLVTADQEYREGHPLADAGHASLILTPDEALLDELCWGSPAEAHPIFCATAIAIDDGSRLLTQRLLQLRASPTQNLQADELAIEIVGRVVQSQSDARGCRPAVIRRAKEHIHAFGFEPLSLSQVAHDVGVSPAYLTQAFKRHEGMPLYRYQTMLRLNQALLELPWRANLTELALDLGFSSHSHFAAAFRSTFNMTPSQYRTAVRRR